MKVTIIIPTYKEQANIGSTIDNLEVEFKKIPPIHQMGILVIDDSSPDDTQAIVKEKAKKYSNVILLPNPQKQGLGAAYIKAFKYAIDKLGSDIIFEYDADGSHQPKYIPGMVKALEDGADVVVGSRYVPGGSMPDNWGINRKLISYFGNLLARSVLWAWQYKDMTSGFRGTKTKFLKQIDLDNLLSKQFAYKIHLYYALHLLKAKIVEYPIDFIDRSKGKSKFPKNNIIDSLRVVFTLRLKKSQKLIKVMIVGSIGAVIQFTIFNLLRSKFVPEIANTLAVETAVIANFLINNAWTFNQEKISLMKFKVLLPKFLQFNLVSLGSILIQFIVLKVGVGILGRSVLWENLLVFGGILIGLVWNFTMYTKIIWKSPKS